MEEAERILMFAQNATKEIALNQKIMTDLRIHYGIQEKGKAKEKTKPRTAAEWQRQKDEAFAVKTIQRLTEKNKKIEALKEAVEKEVEALEYRERKVIYEFYIKGYSWERVSRGFYSVRQCQNFRTEGLKKLDKKFQENPSIQWKYAEIQ